MKLIKVDHKKTMNTLSTELFGTTRDISVANKICIRCKKPADHFRDEISSREYKLSGFCQDCQDWFFKEDE